MLASILWWIKYRRNSKVFKGYVRSYSIKIIDTKDPSVQLKIIKPIIEDLFKDLLVKFKGFEYQITA